LGDRPGQDDAGPVSKRTPRNRATAKRAAAQRNRFVEPAGRERRSRSGESAGRKRP
jgi:hypothetical protein